MVRQPGYSNLELLCFIVNYGTSRKVVKFMKTQGVYGATVFYARGTVGHKKGWKDVLDLSETRKEIVLILVDEYTCESAMPLVEEKFKLQKPNHGIAFRIPVCQIIGSHQYSNIPKCGGVDHPMYSAIYIIVDKGVSEDVVDAAVGAGAKGGTVINARGSGVHETSKVFNMEIAPEKEIILILTKEDETDKVTETIRNTLDMDEQGKGLIFVQDVKKTYGIL